MSNALPTITTLESAIPYLKIWQQRLNPLLNVALPVRCPFNFNVTGATGTSGLTLNWESVKGADGYRIYFSTTGDFSSSTLLTVITNAAQTSFYDNMGASGVKRWYRISATSGTVTAPQSFESVLSAPISASSGTAGTTYDNTSSTSGGGGWSTGGGSGGSGRISLK